MRTQTVAIRLYILALLAHRLFNSKSALLITIILNACVTWPTLFILFSIRVIVQLGVLLPSPFHDMHFFSNFSLNLLRWSMPTRNCCVD